MSAMAAQTDTDMDRQPPQVIEIERAVLGAMLIDKSAIGKAIECLDETHFYKDAHRKIYQAMTAVFERNEPADQLTVAEELRKRKQLDEVGGPLYIAELAGDVATSANIEYHAKIIRDKALLRRLIQASSETIRDVHDSSGEAVEDTIDRAEQRIFQISESCKYLI